ncbi:MAG TPA: hypothetical protein VNN80_32115 [Polyangiaceae bacterium]|jgi:hypothetical protein|nr:hypothetical protein [Polyangiaceae bacterium]
MHPRGLALLSWLAATAALLHRIEPAHAAPPTPAADTSAAPPIAAADTSAASPGGLYLLATGSYGDNTQDIRGMDLAPYSVGAGLDAGYTFPVGLHLGAYLNYSLGRSKAQQYDPLIGRPIDYDADTSSLNTGIGVAWDVPLYAFVLRYKLGFGVTSMTWDFGDVDASDVLYGDAEKPTVGFHFAPGAVVLWQHDKLVLGAGFDYLAQIHVTIPSGFLGKLLIGVKL